MIHREPTRLAQVKTHPYGQLSRKRDDLRQAARTHTGRRCTGQVRGQGFTAPFVQTWDGKCLADLALRYALSGGLRLAAGADNLFDTYPTRWDSVRAAPFPQLGFTHCWETCPFGLNGRSLYLRAEYAF